jgi:lipoate-protein ligase A
VFYRAYSYLYAMLCIHSKNRDPYYNLAAEEYLLKHSGEDLFMLWQSNPAIVVGKHQNTLAEINYRFVRSNGIRIARRLTGGGTVYHDAGNINFSFIRQGEPGRLVDFDSYIQPVISFLKTIGIEATRGLKNEILVAGKKISGNAEHVYKNRVLHHGTLLYNTDLNILRESIGSGGGKYADKAVQSNRSSVLNLVECINPALNIKEFQEALLEYVMKNYQGRQFETGKDQNMAIRQLTAEKYNTWEWIYGWSPDYAFENVWRTNSTAITIKLEAHRGIITGCTLVSPIIPSEMAAMINDQLTGTPHEESNILKTLEAMGFKSILDKRELEDLVLSFF